MNPAIKECLFLLSICILSTLLLLTAPLNRPAHAYDPLDNWNLRSYPPPVTGLTSASSDGSTLVAVGLDGTIVSSTDGATWTRRNSGTTLPLYGVCFGNNRFVAVGANGTVLSSSDGGVSWVTHATGAATLRSVSYGGGRFVAVGDGGTVVTSTTGTSWGVTGASNLQSFGAGGGNLHGVAYGNGVFMAVGHNSSDSASVFTSTIGTSWTTRLLNQPITRMNAVAFGNGTFVVAGQVAGDLTAPAKIWTSANGTIWSTPDIPWWDWLPLNGVTYADHLFVVVGDRGKILSSSDGITWTVRPNAATDNLLGVSFVAGSFVGVADDGYLLQSNALAYLTLTPTALTFSDAAIGAGTAAQTVTIGNSGSVDLMVANMYFTGISADRFNLALKTCSSATPTLAPGGSCSVAVSFAPSAFGSVLSSFTVDSNDYQSPNRVILNANGVARLRLTLTGSGAGQVHSSPSPDIACLGGTCSTSYTSSTALTLTATANAGSSFTGWSGCDSAYANFCYLTTSTSKDVTAEFSSAGCSVSADCGPGSYCSKPAGLCGATGTCLALDVAQQCSATYLPVCGCDNVTYGNECEARRAGAAIATGGECGNSTCNAFFLFAANGAAICQNTASANEVLYVNLPKTVYLGDGAVLKGIVSTDGDLKLLGVTLK